MMSIFVYMDSNPNLYREITKFLRFVYFLVWWHAGAVSLPLAYIIFAHLVWPLNDVNFVYMDSNPNFYLEIALFLSFVYFLVGWHAGAVSLPLGNVIFAHLAYPLQDVNFVYMDSNPNFYLEIALFLSFIMVGWHAGAVNLPLGYIIFAHLACPLNDVNFVYMDSNPNFYLEIALFLSFIMVGWHADAVSLPSGDIIFAHLACPLKDVNFCLYGQQSQSL